MKFLTLSILTRSQMFFQAPKEGGGASDKKKPLSMEEQLESVKAAMASMTSERDALVSERDGLISERDTVKGQFDALSAEATTLRTDLTSARESITALTTERDTANGSLSIATENVSRLEKLCGVKGIDPKNAIAPGEQGEQASDKESRITALQEKLPTASATEKFRIAGEIRKIREERE